MAKGVSKQALGTSLHQYTADQAKATGHPVAMMVMTVLSNGLIIDDLLAWAAPWLVLDNAAIVVMMVVNLVLIIHGAFRDGWQGFRALFYNILKAALTVASGALIVDDATGAGLADNWIAWLVNFGMGALGYIDRKRILR